MRIIFFVNAMSTGGAAKVASQLTLIWRRLGHETVLITTDPQESSEYAHACIAREQIPWDYMSAEKLVALHEKYKFDLVVLNDAINSEALMEFLRGVDRMSGVKCISLVHHTANNWLYTTGMPRELFRDKELSRLDAMVCVDPMWTLWWHHRGCKSIYIPNPVLVQRTLGVTEGAAYEENPCILWVGRIMDWAKQPDKMIAAFVEVCRRRPDARLIMLGTKTKSAERNLLGRVPREIRTKIEMPGFSPNVGDYMSRARLHAFTSLTEVTVPQVILEAQASGLPTVALDMPMLRGKGGVCLVAGVRELADRIVELLEDKAAYKQISLEARSEANARSASSRVEDDWRRLFNCLFNLDEMALWRSEQCREWQNLDLYGALLDELHRSQQYFVQRYLTEYLRLRRIKTRLNIGFLVRRALEKLGLRKNV